MTTGLLTPPPPLAAAAGSASQRDGLDRLLDDLALLDLVLGPAG